jgi:hypothetical protein
MCHYSVCYLAGKLLRTIRDGQPGEEISVTDILCVEIAGLCHDLGMAKVKCFQINISNVLFMHCYDCNFITINMLVTENWMCKSKLRIVQWCTK